MLLFLCLLAFGAVFATDNSTETEIAPTLPGLEKTKEEKYRAYIGERDYVIPFKTRISEPFKEGQTIHALGTIGPNPKRIDFNFHKGAGDDADLPLHLSIRFTEGIFSGNIVYNTFKDGNWTDNEQRISSPYKANDVFDIRVRIINGKFIVYGNRKELGSFEQRMDLKGIDHVSISGDLIKLRVFHYGGTTFPNPYNAIAKVVPGKRLDVSALPNGKRVNLNLYCKNGEYALQISIRFDESAIVRNAMKNGEWGVEEREGEFPLNKNEIFDLTIINEKFSFQIFVNGKRYAAFSHRDAPDDVETLAIDGNVEVNSVTITNA